MTDIEYWLWLTLTKRMNSAKITALLERFSSPMEIFKATKNDFEDVDNLIKEDVQNLCVKRLNHVKKVMEECRKKGIRILTFDNPKYPKKLSAIYDPPYVLYVRSKERIDLDNFLTISVVGTRKVTKYGQEIGFSLSKELARAGVCIVSGLAFGGDAAAHSGALSAGGLTVAVLGNGVDVVYPQENKELMEEIAEKGMLISEYPPKTPPFPENFPRRNRIISGLSYGTVVVEAPQASGTLITADQALEQGRDLFAVPSNINRFTGVGTNNLIKSACAKIVTCADDVLEEYEELYGDLLKANKIYERMDDEGNKMYLSNELYKDLNEVQKKIVLALTAIPTSIESLIEKTGLGANDVSSNLTILEISGVVDALPGKQFCLKL